MTINIVFNTNEFTANEGLSLRLLETGSEGQRMRVREFTVVLESFVVCGRSEDAGQAKRCSGAEVPRGGAQIRKHAAKDRYICHSPMSIRLYCRHKYLETQI